MPRRGANGEPMMWLLNLPPTSASRGQNVRGVMHKTSNPKKLREEAAWHLKQLKRHNDDWTWAHNHRWNYDYQCVAYPD